MDKKKEITLFLSMKNFEVPFFNQRERIFMIFYFYEISLEKFDKIFNI